MIKIKNKLKEIGVTVSELANKLEISRPTLDTYIELYESNKIIPKEKYQKIFECLFSQEVNDKKSFLQLLNHCHDLIERDRLLGTSELGASKTDILTSVVDEIKKDMANEESEEAIYIFINMIIRSYKKEPIFKKLANYFLILNGKENPANISKNDEIYISNYYKLFYEDKHDLLKTNNEYLQKFYKKANEIVEKEQRNKEKIEKLILEKVMSRVDELSKMGINLDDITIKQVLNEIKLDNEQ